MGERVFRGQLFGLFSNSRVPDRRSRLVGRNGSRRDSLSLENLERRELLAAENLLVPDIALYPHQLLPLEQTCGRTVPRCSR